MIEAIIRCHKKILEFNKNETISYEKKTFYLSMSCVVPILLFVTLAFYLDGTNPLMCMYCLLFALYVLLSIGLAVIIKNQVNLSYYFCIFLNIFVIPTMFLMSEGIYFGMVLFFILGMILTVVLLGRQKNVFLIVFFEFVYDVSLIIYTYAKKEKVYLHQSNMSQEYAMALAFGIVSITIIVVFLYQNYVHSEMKKKVDKDNEAIVKAENTKGRFLANMTHEIRTPMNAIIGMTDLMLKEDLSKDTREYTDVIKSASSQLLQIINNILEFSKLDSGRAEIINNEYSLKKLIEDTITNVSNEYVKNNIDLYIFINKNIPDRLFGDEVRIKQVLKYLLYSPLFRTNNGTVSLDLNYDYDDEERVITLQVRIASTGNGLTNEEIEAIYNAYSNYDSRQKTDYNRTGLEFSICQKIVAMMGGDIKIESIEGIGNAVEFTIKNFVVQDMPIMTFSDLDKVFPLIYVGDKTTEHFVKRLGEEIGIAPTYINSPLSFRSALENRSFTHIIMEDRDYPVLKEYIESYNCADKVFVVTSAKNSIGDFGDCKIIRRPVYLFNFIEVINGQYDIEKYKIVIEQEEITYPYARVLCVDDSPVNLKVLENILRDYGITPTTCNSAKEALEFLQSDEFDLLFIDQKMPEMDGIELIQNIRMLSNANATAPAICATADFGNNIREELRAQGFTDYLAKPINKTYLEGALLEYLPKELRVVKAITKKKKAKPVTTEKQNEIDPLDFNPEIGIANLGGNKEAYISVLLSYYEEGVQKSQDVPDILAASDISLYTTNVHALKSSSATVGCMGISPMFKALEFAGKEGNTDFISENNDKTFELFGDVLAKVKNYLVEENAFVEPTDTEEENDDRDVVELDKELLNELSLCILTMNLRRSEEIINILLSNNYGADINKQIKQIKNSYDNFEYFDIKTVIEELL